MIYVETYLEEVVRDDTLLKRTWRKVVRDDTLLKRTWRKVVRDDICWNVSREHHLEPGEGKVS